MNTVAIVQARLGSERFPGKVLADLAGRPLLDWVVSRTAMSDSVDRVVVATTPHSTDDPLVDWATARGIDTFRGSEDDVLSRFYECAREYGADLIVRITADDPLKDPAIIDYAVHQLTERGIDYCSNTLVPTFPEGLDVEVVTFEALETAWREAEKPSEREHVTPYIWKNTQRFKTHNFTFDSDLSAWRWTVDYPADLQFIATLLNAAGNALDAAYGELIDIVLETPELEKLCSNVVPRNEGYLKSLSGETDQ